MAARVLFLITLKSSEFITEAVEELELADAIAAVSSASLFRYDDLTSCRVCKRLGVTMKTRSRSLKMRWWMF